MIPPTPYTEALARIPGPAWLADTRRDALERFLAAGLPATRSEDWRYTSLGYLEKMPLHVPPPHDAVPAAVEDYPGALMAYLDDGLIRQDPGLPEGVATTLAAAGEAPFVRARLAARLGRGALAQLNDALWREGACLHVPQGLALERPLILRFAAASPDAMLNPRVLAVLEPGAAAVLVEHYTGDAAAPYWQNAVTEIDLGPGSSLTHLRLIEEGSAATHTGRTTVRAGPDSDYRAMSLTLGGRLARHDLVVALAGAGARARLDGLVVVDGRRHAEHHLRVAHEAPATTSRTTHRGIAAGRGRAVFDGRVVVHPGAMGADAAQSCHNLILSPHAEIDAKPQLEIYADDVKCAHGAAVGQLDPEQLFYLRSRGIDAAKAHALLLAAFARAALGLADAAGLADWLLPRLSAHLPALAGDAEPRRETPP